MLELATVHHSPSLLACAALVVALAAVVAIMGAAAELSARSDPAELERRRRELDR